MLGNDWTPSLKRGQIKRHRLGASGKSCLAEAASKTETLFVGLLHFRHIKKSRLAERNKSTTSEMRRGGYSEQSSGEQKGTLVRA